MARTAVLDYFRSPAQRNLEKIYDWEQSYALRPTRATVKCVRGLFGCNAMPGIAR